MSEWTPASTLPEKTGLYLIWCSIKPGSQTYLSLAYRAVVVGRWIEVFQGGYDRILDHETVRYWQPVPKSPEDMPDKEGDVRISEAIRLQAANMPSTLQIDTKGRGIMTGRLGSAIKVVAEDLDIPISNGRAIRLHLASYIYEREITTFNNLSHAELWAINHWLIHRNAKGLAGWLIANYAHQLPMETG